MGKEIVIIIPSFDAGGVEKSLINVANGLSVQHQVTILSCVNRGAFRNLISDKIKVESLKVKKLKNALFLLIKFLRKNHFDVVISGPTLTNFIVLLAKFITRPFPKVIITHHNFQDIEMTNLGFKGKIMPWFIRKLYPFADIVISVSEGVKEQLCGYFGVEPNKVKVIYNPIGDEFFYERAQKSVSDFEIYKKEDFVIFIGRLEQVKNCSYLLTLFYELQKDEKFANFKLIIVGDGSEKDLLLNQVKVLDISENVSFLGEISNPLPLLKLAKCLINTSFSEALPTVVIEAMYLNVPVVAASTSGAKEVLEGYSYGIIVDLDDKESFLRSVKRAIDLQLVVGKEGIDERFDSTAIMKKYNELL